MPQEKLAMLIENAQKNAIRLGASVFLNTEPTDREVPTATASGIASIVWIAILCVCNESTLEGQLTMILGAITNTSSYLPCK